jgi:hypothetical protein
LVTFPKGSVSLTVGDETPVRVTQLMLPGEVSKTDVRKKALVDLAGPLPPRGEKQLLGRDILVKYFTLAIAKPTGQPADLSLYHRMEVTPEIQSPPTPLEAAVDAVVSLGSVSCAAATGVKSSAEGLFQTLSKFVNPWSGKSKKD